MLRKPNRKSCFKSLLFSRSRCCEKWQHFSSKNVLLINPPPLYTFYTKAFLFLWQFIQFLWILPKSEQKNNQIGIMEIIFTLCFCIRCICIHAYHGWKINTCEQPFFIITTLEITFWFGSGSEFRPNSYLSNYLSPTLSWNFKAIFRVIYPSRKGKLIWS